MKPINPSPRFLSGRILPALNKLRGLAMALALVLGLLLQLAAPVSAKRWVPPPAPSVMVIPAIAPLKLGDPLSLTAVLRDGKGAPLVDYSLDYYMDFNYFGQARTDATGTALYQTNKKLPAGEHILTVDFTGTKDYLPARVSRRLVVQPAEISVQTFPPMAGISFTMDGRDFLSNQNGVASILIYQVGKYTLTANTDKFSAPNLRIQFGRWETESYQPFRDVDVPVTDPIQAGMNVFLRVGETFVDLDGLPVDPQRVEKITIKSLQGDVFSFTDGSLNWVPSSRVARRLNGLEVTPLQYSVMNVEVDGSNVVNQAQQRFFIQPDQIMKVQLLLYSMHISTSDALFGSPVGKNVRVEFPNGEVHSYPLDSNGTVDVHALARGIYKIEVTGVKGLSSTTPVALSRNQTVAVQLITSQDIAAAGTAGLVVMVGLLLIGRPWLLLPALRRKRALARALAKQADGDVAPEVEGIASIHNN